LFAHDILSWYGKLNEIRNTFFNEQGIFDKLVPASTGIGVNNYNNAAITAELLAVQPLQETVCVNKVISPMQCEALDYKSSFSRATLVKSPDHQRMYISGTASISPEGHTVHLNDTTKQIELTMHITEALIRNGGMNWRDTVRSLVYFKDSSEFGLFDDYCRSAGILLPHVKIHADVCRDDLLFEIELDLIS
jgi:enamine deaminase RidA (YjgF/YER057c/UK114 family)